MEISSGFLAIDIDGMVALTELVADHEGVEPKPEINVQFGACGASSPEELEAQGQQDPEMAVEEGRRHLEAVRTC